MIGRIRRVPLREIWKHEALDFTRWLEGNIDVLNDVLGLSLVSAERERACGEFSVDLVAEDGEGGLVVIENQLERSNHEHLGKLLTYRTSIGARAAVWIVAEPRPEHVAVIAWLNERPGIQFYLVKVEGVCIGDSPPAPLLTLITGPSEEGREIGETKKEIAERYPVREQFWASLLERAKGKTKLHSTISAGQYGSISTSAGKRGLNLSYSVTQHESFVELYLDRGKECDAENKQIFDTLFAARQQIEESFGEPLEWQRLDDARACRIKHRITLGGYRDQARWPEVQNAMIDAMIRFDKALKPHIAALPI